MDKNEKTIKPRLIDLKLPPEKSTFLWGPRKSGKSYLLSHLFPNTNCIDLLKTDVFAEYASQPHLLRERLVEKFPKNRKSRDFPEVVIDEIQKIPNLLNEVHWLIENHKIAFVLTGSSARKLHKSGVNMLGGRAWRKVLMPLTVQEISEVNLEELFVSGLLPPHYLSPNPLQDIRAYLSDYLALEIAQEAGEQELPAFSDFLRVAAITSSELLDYTNMASECGISAKAIRKYFEILEDTFLGFRIQPWKHSKTRRMIQTEKFYLFDVGVTQYLARRAPKIGTPEFGKAFEQFILMELRAFIEYRNPDLPLTFWRTSNGIEVDFILGEKKLVLEIKGTERVRDNDLKGLETILEDGPVKYRVVVSMEKEPRKTASGILILPWQEFLTRLWAGEWER